MTIKDIFWTVPLPVSVAREPKLTPNEKAILAVILSYKTPYLTNWQLQNFTGLSLSTVKGCLRELKRRGVLTRDKRVWKVNLIVTSWALGDRLDRERLGTRERAAHKERKAKKWHQACAKAKAEL